MPGCFHRFAKTPHPRPTRAAESPDGTSAPAAPARAPLPPCVERLFAIDGRSLALFRVSLGALVVVDLIARASSLADHYSDRGVMPREALAAQARAGAAGTGRFCFHAWSGAASFEGLLFVVAGVLAVLFALGRKSTLVALLLWAMTVSLQNRNDLVLNKGDQILRLLLFWSVFAFAPSAPRRSPGRVLGVGGAGLLLQAAVVWLVSACLKTDRAWFPDGTATYYALQMDHGVTALGHWVGQMFPLTRALTYAVYFLEWAAAFLLFSPVFTVRLRGFAIVALAAMHVGFGLCLRLGLFSAISVCSLVPFVPAAWWERCGVGEFEPARQSTAAEGAGRFAAGALLSGVASAALLLVLWINAAAAGWVVGLPALWQPAVQLLRLDQTWAMFAPFPDRRGGWFVARGHLADGTVVDAYHPSLTPPREDKPEHLSRTFPSARWLYYMTNLSKAENAAALPWFGRYLCRQFDAARLSNLPLYDVEIAFFLEWTLPGYQKSPSKREVLWREPCAR